MQNLNRVHLNGLRALESVARLGSLQAAAQELGVTVGAVSQQVIKAEAQLGRPVFARTSKGLVPVEGAAALTARLGQGFQALSEAVALARAPDDTLLTVSVAPVFASRFILPRIDRFTARHPHLRLRLDATARLVDFARDDVDVAIRIGHGDWPGVTADLLLPQTVFPVCAPALARDLRAPEDLLSLPILLDGQAMFSWDIWLAEAGLAGRSIRPRHVFSEASLALEAAIAGQGVMLAWKLLAHSALRQNCLVVPFAIEASTGMGHYCVTRAGARRPAKVKMFEAWLRQELAEAMAEWALLDETALGR
ncbi:LysR substrate-binding domain-containing protein [Rhizobium sp. SSA_523]|uniref:LysR substrate-binding domain-containing protein n=1 Tax=Rhizobium sp. SSA_523 TaxID=2952477 RepID=UPI0020909F9A|nr:LysR substrate-binding domain-containing protein [Rhizobium sp. SSA_523]MCO5730976.1 LysR substrate-binding domain-containing protein [Rhizobium sp. SSA_523]WKC24216.1 LysR substrate-binding domain-containing protein [Rhizobium sp. SSA_523]